MDGPLNCVDLSTRPYPGFPTDMQAQIMALMCVSRGAGVITEGIFENRFMHVQELARLGAHITLSGQSAMVRGRGRPERRHGHGLGPARQRLPGPGRPGRPRHAPTCAASITSTAATSRWKSSSTPWEQRLCGSRNRARGQVCV